MDPTTLLAASVPVESQALAVNGSLVAAFVDIQGADPAANYHASINWGDGTSSAGTIAGGSAATNVPVIGALGVGYFIVTGSHAYATTGDYSLAVTIVDSDGSRATVNGQAHVGLATQATLVAHGLPVASQGLTLNGPVVAAFVDAADAGSTASYTATIDWGDGSSASAGTVAGDSGVTSLPLVGVFSGGAFIVTGSHSYATSGDYQLTVAIADSDGSRATVHSEAHVGQPAPPTPSGSVATLVANVFQEVLHRGADDAGLGFWTQQINGGLSAAQFAADLTHSAESYATNVIDPLYQKFLDRAADPSGVDYWTNQMQQGMTDQQLASSFAASAEFYAKAGGTASAWVNAMYQAVLGRQADSGGLNYWLAQLSAGASRASVATGIAASQESEAQIVQDEYFTYLGRYASPAEVNYWVTQFENGMTNEDIVSAFVGAPEYVKLHS
jgi:hypothetical protein